MWIVTVNRNYPHIFLFAVNSLKEFGKLISSIEDERDKVVSGAMAAIVFCVIS